MQGDNIVSLSGWDQPTHTHSCNATLNSNLSVLLTYPILALTQVSNISKSLWFGQDSPNTLPMPRQDYPVTLRLKTLTPRPLSKNAIDFCSENSKCAKMEFMDIYSQLYSSSLHRLQAHAKRISVAQLTSKCSSRERRVRDGEGSVNVWNARVALAVATAVVVSVLQCDLGARRSERQNSHSLSLSLCYTSVRSKPTWINNNEIMFTKVLRLLYLIPSISTKIGNGLTEMIQSGNTWCPNYTDDLIITIVAHYRRGKITSFGFFT